MQFLKQKWNSLDTLNKFCGLVEIPNINYKDNNSIFESGKTCFITSTLITNEIMLRIMYDYKIENHLGGTYSLFNDVNSTNNFFYDTISNKYKIKYDYENHPFRGITWNGAMHIANIFKGRLPSELEWEICAKSGVEERTYPWGNTKPSILLANYDNYYGNTTEVKKFLPNDWGLYDMAGNLREWCVDEYYPNVKYTYEKKLIFNNNKFKNRVVKGGAWDKTEYHLNSNLSEGKWSRIGTMGIGFRILINID